ncbi:hypothetical protein KDH_45190 [Dictyobacter sp. S3.2.2.5]|uniref:Uncharacterized protein n=1 Tax=Dictyobacter halimunensis TaxID=3026934 RepID=A0ABQ6FVG1_9CHLR|nr:hypothetical protein KDH_45190 [Dictyobacter sp. S3.2.2.5]
MGTPAQRWRAGTTWAGVEDKGRGVVGARGLPSLALAARSTVEGRPYMGIAVSGGIAVFGGRSGFAILSFCKNMNGTQSEANSEPMDGV